MFRKNKSLQAHLNKKKEEYKEIEKEPMKIMPEDRKFFLVQTRSKLFR